jgi:bifunctional non-homologous end joining protein LigD
MSKYNRLLSSPVEISSPEKIIFKEENITKKDISDFYQLVAEFMLPYLMDRPLSLVRCPQGTDHTCFYQKHFAGRIPESFHSLSLKDNKVTQTYISIDSSEGLQELVRLNAFEIHSWNCHIQNNLLPDQVVFDFDPGNGVQWAEVIEAAFELREILEKLNLKSFIKLTGGKGLHLHIPIAPIYKWEEIKLFSKSLALELVSRNPGKYTAHMSKANRNKKIFIDYLRNIFGATVVAPYSLRAKPISSVALPLEWRELRMIKSPQQFSLKKALKKIKTRRLDPWSEMVSLKQKIISITPQDVILNQYSTEW